MFVISKLFWIVAQPLALSLVFLISALVAGFFRTTKTRTGLLIAAILLQFFTLFTTTGALLVGSLEKRFQRPVLDTPPACAIILGGGFDGVVTKVRGNTELGSAGDRFVEGLRLAQVYPLMRLVITGGDPTLDHSSEGDADIAKRFYSDMGIDPDRLLLEPQSRNTIENAELTAPLLKANGLTSCLLVTSAYHMPRSIGLFRKAGMTVIPWPVDYHTTGDERFGLNTFELMSNAQLLNIALHEYIGLAVAYATGKSDSLLPE